MFVVCGRQRKKPITRLVSESTLAHFHSTTTPPPFVLSIMESLNDFFDFGLLGTSDISVSSFLDPTTTNVTADTSSSELSPPSSYFSTLDDFLTHSSCVDDVVLPPQGTFQALPVNPELSCSNFTWDLSSLFPSDTDVTPLFHSSSHSSSSIREEGDETNHHQDPFISAFRNPATMNQSFLPSLPTDALPNGSTVSNSTKDVNGYRTYETTMSQDASHPIYPISFPPPSQLTSISRKQTSLSRKKKIKKRYIPYPSSSTSSRFLHVLHQALAKRTAEHLRRRQFLL